MKKITFKLTLILVSIFNFTYGQQSNIPDSVFFYNENAQKNWFYVQKDIFCFNFNNNTIYNSNLSEFYLPDFVDTIFTYSNSYSTFNAIGFSNNSTITERDEFKNYIKNSDRFKSIAWAISKTQDEYKSYNFYPTDDVVMVTFNNPLMPLSEIDSFANKYGLELVYQPASSLPKEVSWSYSFKLKNHPNNKNLTTIELAQEINEQEDTLVELADPNVFSAELSSCNAPVDELSNSPDNNNYLWYIDNEGGNIYNGQIGIPDADADICECWEEGLTGEGIKIGMIDFGGFEIDHPDIAEADIPYIRDIKNNVSTTQNVYFGDSTTWSHAMLVGGVMIAQPNNIDNSNGHSVGVSYNSTFYPYLCGSFISPGGGSDEDILRSIHKAVADKVDVLNMSFGLGYPGTLSGQLYNAVITGRPNPNNPAQKRGMVVVAGVGNTNNDLTYESGSIFPANQSSTLSVGYSTPEDYRATTTSNGTEGDYSWGMPAGTGSLYGPIPLHFDVVAPGVVIRSTNYINGQGNGYLVRTGSSLASPMVASIVALILEKKPSLTYQEVQNIIRNGAEKVHSTSVGGPYQYGNNGNGYNKKMFFGRVSCINSLNGVNLGIEQENTTMTNIKNNGEGVFIIETSDESLKTVILYSIDGKLLKNESLHSKNIEINLNDYPKGVYLLRLSDNQNYHFATKLVH